MWLSIRVIGMAGMLLIWLFVTGLIAVLLIRETHLRQTECTVAAECVEKLFASLPGPRGSGEPISELFYSRED
jgi:hypothetical protein